MFECAESSFKAKPKQKKKKQKKQKKKNRKENIKHPRGNHYTFNLLSLFWLAENVQWILEVSA